VIVTSQLLLCTLTLGLVAATPLPGQQPGTAADSALQTAEGTVREIYGLVSFEPGTPTDWAKVRNLFLPEAVVSLRTSRTATKVFSVDGFIQDFVTFDTLPAVARNGFTERIVRMHASVFREMAFVATLYEAHIPNAPRPPQTGVDYWLLVRRDGRWWIAAVTNDIPTPEHPIPAELRPQPGG
jgi:hypothetical protein